MGDPNDYLFPVLRSQGLHLSLGIEKPLSDILPGFWEIAEFLYSLIPAESLKGVIGGLWKDQSLFGHKINLIKIVQNRDVFDLLGLSQRILNKYPSLVQFDALHHESA